MFLHLLSLRRIFVLWKNNYPSCNGNCNVLLFSTLYMLWEVKWCGGTVTLVNEKTLWYVLSSFQNDNWMRGAQWNLPKTALASKTCCRVATCVLSIRNIAFKLTLVRQVLKKIKKNKPWGYLKHQLINAYTYSFQSSNPPSRDDVLQSIWNKNTQTKKIALISKDQSHTPFEWDSPQNNSGTCTKAQFSRVTR